jgi:hypothetical protein
MPFTKPKFRSRRPQPRGVGPDLGRALVALLTVFGCGRETMDLAVSRSGSPGDAGGSRDGAADSSPGQRGTSCEDDSACVSSGSVCLLEKKRCGCSSGGDCKFALVKACDLSTNECVQCVDDVDCPQGIGVVCDQTMRRCTVPCTPGGCTGWIALAGLGFCNADPERSVCVECAVDDDCGAQRFPEAALKCQNGACVQCSDNGECHRARR